MNTASADAADGTARRRGRLLMIALALTGIGIRWRRPLIATAVVSLAVGLSLIPLTVSEARDDDCSNTTLTGAYGFKGNGSVVLPNGTKADVAVVGRTVFDGRGGLSGSDTNSFNGTITRETTTGTYHVNKDCTGSETFTSSSGNKVNADFVIVENGRKAFFIETDPGVVLTVTAERQQSSDRSD
jgi:hypothetical protein